MKLKGLLGFLLVFGLSLSFSFADNTWYDRDISTLGYSPVDSDLNIAVNVKGQLLTTSNGISKNMLFIQDSSDYKTLFFWTRQGLPYAYIYLNSTHTAYQGVPIKYRLCDTGFNRDNTPCTGYDLTLSSVGLFSDFLSKVNNSDVWSFIGYGNFFRICISSEIYGKSLCFGYSSYNGDGCSHLACYKNSVLTGYSLDIDSGITFENFPVSVLGQSPGVSSSNSSGDNNNSEVIVFDGLTGLNKNYYDLYKRIGFYSGLCYSDFSLDNLVNSGTDFYDLFLTDLDDGEAYTGATIFDLKSQWFPSSSFISYFNNANAVYKTVFNNNDRFHIYNGLSKGQYRIFMKLNNADFIDTYTLSPIDVNTFCDFVINGYDPNGIFTGDTSISAGNIKQNIDISTTVYLSGSDVDFSGATDLFGIFNDMYSRFKGAFPVDDRLSSHSVGILPTYIILGFFLFVLLYGLKR